MVKIRRKKGDNRISEALRQMNEDEYVALFATTGLTLAPAQPATLPANNAQPAATTTGSTTTTAPAPATTTTTTTGQAPVLGATTTTAAQPLQQQEEQKNPYEEKIKTLLDDKHLGNSFWAMSVNVPEEIQKVIPDFKEGNEAAKPAIDAWNAYKLNPTEETFKNFLTVFGTFGAPQQANNGQQPAQPAANGQQPAAQPNESIAVNFSNSLHENLNFNTKMDYYKKVLENYFEN